MKAKRYYSKEFRLQAISMAEVRENIAEVARELDIHSGMLRRWSREYKEKETEAFQGTGHPPKRKDKNLSELQQLKKELKRSRTRTRYIKKSGSHLLIYGKSWTYWTIAQ